VVCHALKCIRIQKKKKSHKFIKCIDTLENMLPYIAEYLGTFFFVLAIFSSGGNPLIIGGALALVIFLTAPISSGNINPAVSLGMFLNNQLSMNKFLGYVVAQLLGGASAYYTYRMAKH
jgi:aquaporin Z